MHEVRKPSTAVEAMAVDWALIDALMGGTGAMRTAGKKHLPQWPAEDAKAYQARLGTATLFPAYARTVSVLTGKPFSKPLTIGEDVPPRIAAWLEDVDLQHRNLHTFAAEVCQEGLAYGLCGILVDCPQSGGARSVAQEKVAGIRPYMLHIRPQNILGWRAQLVNGSRVLTQLRLLEAVEVDDGEFGTATIEQVRVLEIGRWATYRKASDFNLDTWMLYEEGVTSLKVIPFVPVYGKRVDFMIGTPPMLELAHANVEHWQSKSDQQTILHVARVPVMFGKVLGEAEFVIGAGTFIEAADKESDLKYVEHSGKAIEAGRLSILDLEDRMRQTGAELLVIKPGNVTVAETLSDNELGMCDLQRIMQAAEDGIDAALGFMAAWVGEKDGGHVSIYRDFGAATLAESSAALLFEMCSVGKLSNATLYSELKRRGVISPDIVIEEEIAAAKRDAPPVAVTEAVNP